MTGHRWSVKDMVTGETFEYKRYAPSGAYYMKRQGESADSLEFYVRSYLSL